MRAAKTAAVAQAALFRRVRTLLIRPYEKGLAATTLNFDYEVRSAERIFSTVPAKKISGEMLDLAMHIIRTKQGAFDPRAFHDRYEGGAGRSRQAQARGQGDPEARPQRTETTVNLMQALRDSAGGQRERQIHRQEGGGGPAGRGESKDRFAASQGRLTDGARSLSKQAQLQGDRRAQGARTGREQRHLRRPEARRDAGSTTIFGSLWRASSRAGR